MHRRTFNVEVEFGDEPTESQINEVLGALSRVGKFVPGRVEVTQAAVLPVVTQGVVEPTPIGDAIPFGMESEPNSPAPAAAVPNDSPGGGDAVALFPKGAPLAEQPETKPAPTSNPDPVIAPGIHLTRDVLASLAQGAYSGTVADFFGDVLARMPVGVDAVDVHVTYCD